MELSRTYQIIKLKAGRNAVHIYSLSEQCLYSINRVKGEVKYLKCIDRGCQCTAKIVNNEFEKGGNSQGHNHLNHKSKAEYEIAFSKLKEDVSKSSRPVRAIYNETLRQLSIQASGLLEWGHVRHTLQRIRRNMMPSCPNLNTFINLLETNDTVYGTYGMLHNDPFYQGSIDNKIVVFANLHIISRLDETFDMFVDATFKITPFKIYQLLVVMAEVGNKPRPVVYALMTAKSAKQYTLLFRFIRDVIFPYDGINRSPVSAMVDFEKAMRRGLKNAWPRMKTLGCNFHHLQCLRRKAASIATLSTKIKGPSQHHDTLLLFMRLSLLPIDKIRTGYTMLKNHINRSRILSNDFKSFMAYFTQTWFKSYPIQEWCVSDRSRRTNNNLEAYNRSIKRAIPSHPSPFIFLDGLLNLSYDATAKYTSQIQNGSQAPPDRSLITVALRDALDDLDKEEINEFEFLQRMSHTNYN